MIKFTLKKKLILSAAVQNQRAPRGPGGKSISNKVPTAKFANRSPVTFASQRSPLNRLTNIKEIAKRRTPSLTPPHTPKQKDNKISISSSAELYDVSVRILYESIAWARNIPTFNELPLSDQALLLENCWNELLLLSIAQWSVPIDLDHLIEIGKLAECGYVSNRAEPKTIKYLQRLLNIIQKFHEIKLDTMEYSCVKAIIVFKPGRYTISDLCCLKLWFVSEKSFLIQSYQANFGQLGSSNNF